MTFMDGVRIIVDNVTSECQRDMVAFHRDNVNDTDFKDWSSLSGRYTCVVKRAPQFGAFSIVIIVRTREVKSVEFVN